MFVIFLLRICYMFFKMFVIFLSIFLLYFRQLDCYCQLFLVNQFEEFGHNFGCLGKPSHFSLKGVASVFKTRQVELADGGWTNRFTTIWVEVVGITGGTDAKQKMISTRFLLQNWSATISGIICANKSHLGWGGTMTLICISSRHTHTHTIIHSSAQKHTKAKKNVHIGVEVEQTEKQFTRDAE